MLDERKKKILQAIIDDYIFSAEPIGSRTIARKHSMGISPATIRNEMADLEVLGYLEQPHASAGRIPSAQGYRFYVDCLMTPTQITENDINMINQWYNTKVRRIEEVFLETAKMISRMTRNVSLVLVPQNVQSTFMYLQFLPFNQEKVVAVIVTDSGYIEHKIIDIPMGIAFQDLQLIAQRITNRLYGTPLEKIHTSLLQEIQNELMPDKAVVERVLEAIRQTLAMDKKNRIYTGGTTQLLEQPEFKDVEKVRGILNMLEEERLLIDILQMNDYDGVAVTIGQENKFSGIKDCSMVQATYRIDGQVVGTVAVLGPTRMEYGKVMAILQFMHNHLGGVIEKYRSS